MSEAVNSSHVLAGKHALVVDDDDDARRLLRNVLESVQMVVCEADCVDEALSKLDARTFNLIVSDIGMPDRDGYSFMRTVRERPDGGVVRTLALTSFAQIADRALALDAGFDQHLGKPMRSDTLIPCLVSLLAQPSRVRKT